MTRGGRRQKAEGRSEKFTLSPIPPSPHPPARKDIKYFWGSFLGFIPCNSSYIAFIQGENISNTCFCLWY